MKMIIKACFTLMFTGSHDAYNIGDRVHFPTLKDPVYESLIDGNTYSPIEYERGWELIEETLKGKDL